MRSSWLRSRGAILSWLFAGACLGGDPTNDPARARPSTIIVSHRQLEDALIPTTDTWARFLVFLPLVGWSEEGDLEGRLAQSWEHSADYRTWTYHLRTDVTWHDGEPVTAHDVKFTLDLLSHPDVLYFSPSYVESVEVLNDSTVSLWSAGFNADYSWWITYVPKHLLEELDPKAFTEWSFWTNPIGNGAYRYVRHEPATMMAFEANPDFYGGRPRIERVILKFDPGGRLTELLSGNVDVISTANPSEIPKLQDDSRFRVFQFPDGLVRGLYWKCDHPVLGSAEVRRALTLGIDRRELQRVLSVPETFPVVDGIVMPEDLLRGAAPAPLPYDPDSARALLAAAGWRDRDGDGVLDRDGRPLSFRLLVQGSGAGVWSRAAVFVQEQLRFLGVRMEISGMQLAVVRERLLRGEFEAALTFVWPDVAWLGQVLGDRSVLAYRNPSVVRLVEELARTASPEARRDIYLRLITIFQREAPITFLGPVAWTTVTHRRVGGLSSPWRTNPLQHMDRLWLEADAGERGARSRER